MKKHLLAFLGPFLQKMIIFFTGGLVKQSLTVHSQALQRLVELEVFSLRQPFSPGPLSLLLLNDGQDFPALKMEDTLRDLQQQNQLNRLLVVGIKAADRMQEYGTASQPDYAGRGARAKQYTQFVVGELLPFLSEHFALKQEAAHRVFGGFSLGGLSALDIAWHHPNLFQKVGVFSGSLWWRAKKFNPKHPDADRIMHQLIARGPKREGMQFWLQTGTLDETADRNKNGVIDAIDDTLDLIAELEKLGYKNGRDITYVEVEGGEHHPGTWGEVMRNFLLWGFG